MSSLLHVQTAEGPREIRYQEGETLHAILSRENLPIGPHCSGQGQCGRCRVRWRTAPPNPTACELIRLQEDEISQGIRLSCQHKPTGNHSLSLLRAHDLRHSQSSQIYLQEQTFNSTQTGLGIAIDCGTTLIRISLWDFDQMTRLSARSFLNPLIRFGQDILSRLCQASESRAKSHQMLSLCAQSISSVLYDLLECFEREASELSQITLVANTAMLSLLGHFHHEITVQPGCWIGRSEHLGDLGEFKSLLKIPLSCEVKLEPSLGGFVGSDLWAGLVYSQLCKGGPSLLMDFGTNTEIALWTGSELWLCSAAGGPAFDGCGIKCGIHASPGAIDQVQIHPDLSCTFHTVDDQEAHGICGSGLIELCAGLLEREVIRKNGLFSRTWPHKQYTLHAGKSLFVDQSDLGLLQQAIAAIKAGLLCLFHRAHLQIEQLEQLWICGDFGGQISIPAAQALGLLPQIHPDRIRIEAHAALLGSEQLMHGHNPYQELSLGIHTVNLSNASDFEEFYISSLLLQPLQSCPDD